MSDRVRIAIASALGGCGLAVAAAALAVLAYPPVGFWPAAFLMAAPQAWLAGRHGVLASFALAWLAQVLAALFIVQWLVIALAGEYQVEVGRAWGFTALLVGAYSLVPALAVGLFARRRWSGLWGPWIAPLVFGSLFIANEWVRSELLGLPWVLAGQAVAFVPLWTQVADLGGVFAVGLPLVTMGAGIGLAAHWRSHEPLVLPAALLVGVAGYGVLRLAEPVPEEAEEGLEVLVVQASIPLEQRWQPGSAARNQAFQADITRRAWRQGPADLVVWPETALDGNLDQEPGLGRAMGRLADALGVPVVTGARVGPPRAVSNSVVVFEPGRGRTARYDKRRLVPFAEYDPGGFAWLGALIEPVTAGAPYVPGRGPRVLRLGGLGLGTPICFEVTHAGPMRGFAGEGARLLLNLSNDTWFGRSGFSRLHLAHAVMRAVELRTPMVRAANSGISAVIDSRGRLLAEAPLFERTTLRARVTPRPEARTTLYGRLGDAPLGCVLAVLAGLALRAWPRLETRVPA